MTLPSKPLACIQCSIEKPWALYGHSLRHYFCSSACSDAYYRAKCPGPSTLPMTWGDARGVARFLEDRVLYHDDIVSAITLGGIYWQQQVPDKEGISARILQKELVDRARQENGATGLDRVRNGGAA